MKRAKTGARQLASEEAEGTTDWTTARQARRHSTLTGEDERAKGGSRGKKGRSIKKWGWKKSKKDKRKKRINKKKIKIRKRKHRRRWWKAWCDRSEERGRKRSKKKKPRARGLWLVSLSSLLRYGSSSS